MGAAGTVVLAALAGCPVTIKTAGNAADLQRGLAALDAAGVPLRRLSRRRWAVAFSPEYGESVAQRRAWIGRFPPETFR